MAAWWEVIFRSFWTWLGTFMLLWVASPFSFFKVTVGKPRESCQ